MVATGDNLKSNIELDIQPTLQLFDCIDDRILSSDRLLSYDSLS